MKENSLVSVIIPVYNCEKFITRCVKSISNQSYKNLEIILVNDWSKDNSLKVIEELEKSDNRIHVFTQENQGSSVARNLWIQKSKWDYIAFIDSDDFIKEDYVSTLVNYIWWDDILLCWHIRYKWEDNQKEFYFKDNPLSKYLLCPPWWRMFKSEFVKKNKIEFPKWLFRQDSVFNMRAFNLTKKIAYIHYAWYYYNLVNEWAVTQNQFKKFDPRIIEWLDLLNNIEPIDWDNKEMKEYAIVRACISYLLYSWVTATRKEFIAEYNKIFWWLKKNIPNYCKNKFIYMSEDTLLYKICVRWFILLDKCKLVTIIFWIIQPIISYYCKIKF